MTIQWDTNYKNFNRLGSNFPEQLTVDDGELQENHFLVFDPVEDGLVANSCLSITNPIPKNISVTLDGLDSLGITPPTDGDYHSVVRDELTDIVNFDHLVGITGGNPVTLFRSALTIHPRPDLMSNRIILPINGACFTTYPDDIPIYMTSGTFIEGNPAIFRRLPDGVKVPPYIYTTDSSASPSFVIDQFIRKKYYELILSDHQIALSITCGTPTPGDVPSSPNSFTNVQWQSNNDLSDGWVHPSSGAGFVPDNSDIPGINRYPVGVPDRENWVMQIVWDVDDFGQLTLQSSTVSSGPLPTVSAKLV